MVYIFTFPICFLLILRLLAGCFGDDCLILPQKIYKIFMKFGKMTKYLNKTAKYCIEP